MADSADPIDVTRDGAVLVLRINRSDTMNALTREMEDDLHSRLLEGDRDPEVRAIVLTGSGRAFSAGFNMAREYRVPTTGDEKLANHWRRDFDTVRNLLSIMEMEKPVIAGINGWALGGGFWYALVCDISIAAESAVFGQPEVRHVSNTSFLFAALAGWKNAHRYALTGDHFDAAEALRIGVVSEVVPDDSLDEHCLALAHRLALVPTASIRANKAVTNLGLEAMGLRSAMMMNAALSVIAHGSNDAEEARALHDARRAGHLKEFLAMRDDPFRPEPSGPRRKQ